MAKYPAYKSAAGKRVPSVTTILSRFKESGGLLYWANQAGLDGKTLDEARIPAATSGTMAHDLVEAWIHKRDLPELKGPKEVVKHARDAFATYRKWEEQTSLVIRHTEIALISEGTDNLDQWGNPCPFGGRMDAIGLMGNEMVLVDWKTSNSVYVDYTLQMAAYQLLWDENYPDHPLTGGFHLCRFAKEQGDFAHFHYPSLEAEAITFLSLRRAYSEMKVHEKRVK